MPISMASLSRQGLSVTLLIMAVALAACSTGTSAPPTVAATPGSASVANAPTTAATSSTPASGSAGGTANGTLQTALDRLNKATSFHFVFTVNGKNQVEGDSSGIQGNFHFTSNDGEWLITSGAHGAIYKNQGGKWVVDSSGLNGLSYTTVIELIAHDAKLTPAVWQASGTQKIGDQDTDYYTYSGPHGVNTEKEDAWVGKSSGDIVQLQETITFKSNGAVSSVTLMTVSKIDQPVAIPAPQ
ncbi:MAG: hypothetical protein ACYDBJ_02010 [Aggregatilineales bacterium]